MSKITFHVKECLNSAFLLLLFLILVLVLRAILMVTSLSPSSSTSSLSPLPPLPPFVSDSLLYLILQFSTFMIFFFLHFFLFMIFFLLHLKLLFAIRPCPKSLSIITFHVFAKTISQSQEITCLCFFLLICLN